MSIVTSPRVGAAWYRTDTEATHGHGVVAEDVPAPAAGTTPLALLLWDGGPVSTDGSVAKVDLLDGVTIDELQWHG